MRSPIRAGVAVSAVAASVLLAAGCGEADLPASVSVTSPPTTTTDDLEAALDPTCVGGAAVEVGTSVQRIATSGPSGDGQRSYLQHIPLSYEGVGMPVVVALHGDGSTAGDFADVSGLVDKAEEDGFVLLVPQGLGEPATWDPSAGSPDVTFLADVLDQAQTAFCLESQRVYAAGTGSGGTFAGRLACDLSARVAAVAGVGDVGAPVACEQARPVPVLGIFPSYANADQTIPSEGLVDWAERYGCEPPPATVETTAAAEHVVLEGCDEGAAVEYHVVSAGDLVGEPPPWPTGPALYAGDAVWTFFVDHPLR